MEQIEDSMHLESTAPPASKLVTPPREGQSRGWSVLLPRRPLLRHCVSRVRKRKQKGEKKKKRNKKALSLSLSRRMLFVLAFRGTQRTLFYRHGGDSRRLQRAGEHGHV